MNPAHPEAIPLGVHVIDLATGIDGTYVAITHWHDRSDEVAISRSGVDSNGTPWPVHWFPISRMERA